MHQLISLSQSSFEGKHLCLLLYLPGTVTILIGDAHNEIMETPVASLTSSITQNSITFRCRHFVYC